MLRFRVPIATYRIQFNRHFGFRQARALLPYLSELGISDVYASPLVQAQRGSPHCYDVTDPSRLNRELGTQADFDRFAQELRRRKMGLLLDIVPNHMAASSDNPWWREVLEDGRLSPFANYFDVDWNLALPPAADKLILPILGEPCQQALEQGRLRLALEEGRLVLRYYDAWYPLRLQSQGDLLRRALGKLQRRLGDHHPLIYKLRRLVRDCEQLASPRRESPRTLAESYREKRAVQARLTSLVGSYAGLRRAIQATLREFNHLPGSPRTLEPFERLLRGQRYRLTDWRAGEVDINYRRFFDISDLVSLRTEDSRVFAARHSLHRRLVRTGKVTGLRVDHVDGLADPKAYLDQLQMFLCGSRRGRRSPGFYVVVEKVLNGEEQLPQDWSVCGTTGYEFLNRVTQLQIAPIGSRRLKILHHGLTRRHKSFADVARESKRLVMQTLFPGEVWQLTRILARVAANDARGKRLAPAELRTALVELTACLPLYRTYIKDGNVTARDQRIIRHALRDARRRATGGARRALEFVAGLLLPSRLGKMSAEGRAARLEFARRWQQFTGPVMAKGVEDTALYAYSRLLALNEVGGDPDSDGLAAKTFHLWLERRAREWPFSLNATTTHDTKRSEDLRARLASLSEMSGEWEKRLNQWRRWNHVWKRNECGRAVPEPDKELLLYQTLMGVWPVSGEVGHELRLRLQHHAVKAAREAKVFTRWREVNPDYEKALLEFLGALLRPGHRNRFRVDLQEFTRMVAQQGALNSLSQLLIKISAPGVPDFYQGSELWDLRLVDPDNRGPVDFDLRRRWLAELKDRDRRHQSALLKTLLENWEDGRLKLYLLWKALRFRRAHADLFLKGNYLALQAIGTNGNAIFAFARRRRRKWAVTVVPCLSAHLRRDSAFPLGLKSWDETQLILPDRAPAVWRNQISGNTLRISRAGHSNVLLVGEILGEFPVALLAAEAGQGPSGCARISSPRP